MTKSRDIASATPAPSTVSSAELGYLDGVTSAIQTQVDAKLATATAASTYATIANDNLKAPLASPTFTGTVTIPAGVVGTAANAGYMGIPQNSTTTGSATVAAADGGNHIYATATRTITIDSNANLALPVGFTFTVIADAGATVTIAITTDTMYLSSAGTTGSRTLAPYGMATAVKVTSTKWAISGNGLT